jgi:hypothetical protein
MKILKTSVFSAFVLLIAALTPIAAKADQGDWSTKVSINQPVQIGKMVLTPGTYMFRRADTWAPDVVEVYNLDTNRYEGMILGFPASQSSISGNSTFILKEGAKGSPESLQYWFYPGNSNGLEFFSPHVTQAGNPAAASHTAG